VKNQLKGTVNIVILIPNPGTLVVSSKLVRAKTIQLTDPGALNLNLRPTKKTRRGLVNNGRAKGPVSLTYTPSFGTSTTDTTLVGLKLKR
jgi:hypothetical protein